jgi:hypothetical protein
MPADEYCDFCDLPMAHCVHGQPQAAEPAGRPAQRSAAKRAARPAATSAAKPRKRAAAASGTATRTVDKPVTRRWTAPEALKPAVLAVLEEAGGELEAAELFSRLEQLVGDRLLAGDRERTPEGELRWQYAARRARVALIDEGLMTKGVPGVWKLADTSRARP